MSKHFEIAIDPAGKSEFSVAEVDGKISVLQAGPSYPVSIWEGEASEVEAVIAQAVEMMKEFV